MLNGTTGKVATSWFLFIHEISRFQTKCRFFFIGMGCIIFSPLEPSTFFKTLSSDSYFVKFESLKLAQVLKSYNKLYLFKSQESKDFKNVKNNIVSLIFSDISTLNFDLSFIYIYDRSYSV